MSVTALFTIIIFLAMIVSSVLVLKRSAKKFNLTEQEKQNIKKRNSKLEQEEKEEDNY